jgi:hypothetical protein
MLAGATGRRETATMRSRLSFAMLAMAGGPGFGQGGPRRAPQ